MKITPKIIENVVSEVAGADVIPVIKYLKNKKNISEFKIAEDLGLEVNKTRNILYRLHGANLVSFIRKKDKEKGWYIYYWTFNQARIRDLMLTLKKNKVIKLNERLERENQCNFFICENTCMRLDFEQAICFDFKIIGSDRSGFNDYNSATISTIRTEIIITVPCTASAT